jgi:hypothetical protein
LPALEISLTTREVFMPPHNASSWKELSKGLSKDVEFGAPAKEDGLATLEQALGTPLPAALREFLLEADGLRGDDGSGVIWSAHDIQEQNRELRSNSDFRRLYMPFDHLLFFVDDAGGDRFAFAIKADGQIRRKDIYQWAHETDSRSWYAARLEQYLERRLKKRE